MKQCNRVIAERSSAHAKQCFEESFIGINFYRNELHFRQTNQGE